MSRQTVLELPDATFDRLQALASRTGRSAESHIREALEERLDDADDIRAAEIALVRRARGESRTLTLDEIGRELGLDG